MNEWRNLPLGLGPRHATRISCPPLTPAAKTRQDKTLSDLTTRHDAPNAYGGVATAFVVGTRVSGWLLLYQGSYVGVCGSEAVAFTLVVLVICMVHNGTVAGR